MMATRPLTGSYGLPAGAWRWAALGFVALALVAAGIAVGAPNASNWAGVALLAGIGAVASLFLYAVWPREGVSAAEARRVAEAAARANVAWAVTGPDGAVLDCNEVYRRMAGTASGEAPAPPELALAGEASAAVLYRLSRRAAEGKAGEESFRVGPGLELVAAVRPLTGKPGGLVVHARGWAAPHEREPAAAAPQPHRRRKPPHRRRPAPADAVPRRAGRHGAGRRATGKLVETNAAFDAFFGLSGQAAGRSLAELVEPADREAVGALLAAGAGRRNAGPGGRRTAPARGRRDRMARTVRPAPFSGGEQAVLYLIDISEQKALETKFAQSQKMQAVGQLAGGVAHDFNNLLTVIIGNSEFLLMRHQAGDPSFKEINEIHQNALRAATLVGQLLAFSRKQTLQPKVLVLRDMVGELALMLRRLLREGVELELEHGADLWPVHADETQISNAIINLVVNARDAMPKGGTVTIRTANESVASRPRWARRSCRPAIMCASRSPTPAAASPRNIWARSSIPSSPPSRRGRARGWGSPPSMASSSRRAASSPWSPKSAAARPSASICRALRGEAAPAAEAERAPPRDVTGQDTILLVEDEEAVRSFAARALKLRGYNVLEASGGEEALEIVKSHGGAIHLLVTDVVMPNMDGPTLVRNVRRLLPDIQVIFMSGYAEEAFRRNDEKAEDLHFLPKPFGLKQLAAKVKDVLSGAPA